MPMYTPLPSGDHSANASSANSVAAPVVMSTRYVLKTFSPFEPRHEGRAPIRRQPRTAQLRQIRGHDALALVGEVLDHEKRAASPLFVMARDP